MTALPPAARDALEAARIFIAQTIPAGMHQRGSRLLSQIDAALATPAPATGAVTLRMEWRGETLFIGPPGLVTDPTERYPRGMFEIGHVTQLRNRPDNDCRWVCALQCRTGNTYHDTRKLAGAAAEQVVKGLGG